MDVKTDQDLAQVIDEIAALRKKTRAITINVTSLFDPMTSYLSLAELRSYLIDRYPSRRGDDAGGKYDMIYIDELILRSFNSSFISKDQLTIGFRYNSDWTEITELLAVLRNHQL